MRGLLGCAVAHYTAVVGFRVALVLAAVAVGLSPATIGLILATFALVPMLFAVRGGQAIDRLGVRMPMIVGTSLSFAGTLACAALPIPVVFALSAGVVGLGMMSFHLAMQHAAGEIGGPGRRHANFNALTMSFSISGLLGPPTVGLVIDTAGHRAAFALVTALLGGVLLVLMRFPFDRVLPAPAPAPDPPPAAPAPAPAPEGTETDSEPPAPAPAHALALLGSPRLRRLLAASLLASAAWDVYQFVLPLHAGAIGLSASAVGLAVAGFSAGSLTVRLLMPRLVSRMRTTGWMKVSLGIGVVSFALAPFAGRLEVLLLLSFLIGVGPGIAQPLLLARLHEAAPPGRAGEAAGLRMTLLSAMQLVVPIGLGLLAGLIGSTPLFWLYAASAAAIGLLLLRAEKGASAPRP
jgi:MFS family permease